MHKNVKGTRKIPEVCTSGIFRLKIAQKQKTPEKFKFFGSLWGFFVCSEIYFEFLLQLATDHPAIIYFPSLPPLIFREAFHRINHGFLF